MAQHIAHFGCRTGRELSTTPQWKRHFDKDEGAQRRTEQAYITMAGPFKMECSLNAASTAVETPTEPSDTGNMAPWERDNIPQVPYMTKDSLVITQFEKKGPPAWPAHHHDPYVSTNTTSQRHTRSRGRSHSPIPGYLNAPRTAPLQQPRQSEDVPGLMGPRTAPQLPCFVKASSPSPETSEWSSSSTVSSTRTSPFLGYEQESQPTTAIPGTMTARARDVSKVRSKHQQAKSRIETEPTENTTFGKKFRTALKDAFKRSPMDDASYEKVEGTHWTD